MLNRRHLLGTAGAAVVAGAIGAPLIARASSLTPVNLGVGGITFAYLPLFVAHAAGYFRDEGLDVSITNANGGANALAAAIGGSVDICGLVMSDIILAASKNQKIQAFAPLMSQYASDAVISTAAAEKIGFDPNEALEARMARLKGLTLGISSRGSGIDKLWRYLISLGGLDPDTDTTLTVVKLDQMYPALISGQIDGFNTTAPANNRAVAEGKAVWLARPSRGEIPELKDFLYTVLAATPDYLAKHPDQAAKMTGALKRGAELIHADPAQAGSLMRNAFFALSDEALIVETVRDQVLTVAAPPKLTEAQFVQNRDFMTRFGHDVAKITFADVVNPTWVNLG